MNMFVSLAQLLDMMLIINRKGKEIELNQFM